MVLSAGVQKRLLFAALVWASLSLVSAPGSDDDDDDGRTSFSGITAKGTLAGLTIVMTTLKFCQLCDTRTDAAHPWEEEIPDGGPWWPWLHYKRVDAETKTPSAKMCLFRRQVFRSSHVCVYPSFICSLQALFKFNTKAHLLTRGSRP